MKCKECYFSEKPYGWQPPFDGVLFCQIKYDWVSANNECDEKERIGYYRTNSYSKDYCVKKE